MLILMLIFLFKGKIMITPLKYKPTVLKITENAANALRKRQDDDTVAFALEIIRNNRTINTPQQKQKNFRQRINRLFSTKSQMEVILDEKQGNFFLNVIRRIGLLQFVGKNAKIDLNKIVMKKNSLDEALLESKEAVLSQIQEYNKAKKLFKI